MATIIPITMETGDVIEYDLKELPSHKVLIKLFKTLDTELYTWIKFALEYYNRGDIVATIELLESSHRNSKYHYQGSDNDQIISVDLLAACYMKMANSERTELNRQKYLSKITKLYNSADKAILYNSHHLLGIIFVRLLEDFNMKKAHAVFSYKLDNAMSYLSPQIGRQCIEFKMKKPKIAFRLHRESLNERPINLVMVRITLANYYLTHGQIEKAQSEFKNALKLNPGCVDALIGLVIIELNSESLVSISLCIYMSKQYEIKTKAVNKIINEYHSFEQYARLKKFALNLLKNTMDASIRSECYYAFGIIHENEKNYEKAKKYYSQANILAKPGTLHALFSLGQMHTCTGNICEAIKCFDKIQQTNPSFKDIDKILDELFASTTINPIIQEANKLIGEQIRTKLMRPV